MTEKTVPAVSEAKDLKPREETREEERYLVPPVDIYENDEALILVADLPGVKKEEVDVQVKNDVLTLQARSKYVPKEDYLFQEFGLRNYFRQFQLSEAVDRNRIQATLKHGVLNLVLPKAEKAKPRRIDIKMG